MRVERTTSNSVSTEGGDVFKGGKEVGRPTRGMVTRKVEVALRPKESKSCGKGGRGVPAGRIEWHRNGLRVGSREAVSVSSVTEAAKQWTL